MMFVSCRGAAISFAFSSSLAPIFLVVYIKWRKLYQQTWGGWSFESLTEWWQFLRLGVPGLLLVASEWWSFEISSVVVGTIDETQLAINAVLIQYGALLYMVS
jgi:MATE family multidrug resistance protein